MRPKSFKSRLIDYSPLKFGLKINYNGRADLKKSELNYKTSSLTVSNIVETQLHIRMMLCWSIVYDDDYF